MLKLLLAIPFLALLAALLLTYLALEIDGVISIQTLDGNQQPRVTHVWHVVHQQRLTLEAGHPDNPWVQDLAGSDQVSVRGDGLDGNYSFVVNRAPSDHQLIRQLMRKKYGWRDSWISLLFDTSRSAMVQLDPIPNS
ncbi:MAG: hypothetical protein ACR2PZ_19615 [Pseudomonadales bacterium]